MLCILGTCLRSRPSSGLFHQLVSGYLRPDSRQLRSHGDSVTRPSRDPDHRPTHRRRDLHVRLLGRHVHNDVTLSNNVPRTHPPLNHFGIDRAFA